METVVAALMNSICVMDAMTAAIIVMKIQRSAKLTVSHSLSHNVELYPLRPVGLPDRTT